MTINGHPTFLLTTPSLSRNFTNLSKLRDLLRMSIVWSSIGTYCNITYPSSTSWRMKWQWSSTCLVRSWKTRFLASFSTLWLSQNKGEGLAWDICMSTSILQSHTTSHTALTIPWYHEMIIDIQYSLFTKEKNTP